MSEPVSELLFASPWTSFFFLDQKLAFFLNSRKILPLWLSALLINLPSTWSVNTLGCMGSLFPVSLSVTIRQNLKSFSFPSSASILAHEICFDTYRYIISYIFVSITINIRVSQPWFAFFFQFLSFIFCLIAPRFSKAFLNPEWWQLRELLITIYFSPLCDSCRLAWHLAIQNWENKIIVLREE